MFTLLYCWAQYFLYLHWTCDTTSFFFLQYWLPAKRKCDHNLRSNETHAGTQQTTLSRLSLADRAWETDDDESLMLSTPITNKTHRRTHTRTRCVRTHIYVRSLPHLLFPIYSRVFFSVPSVILWWQGQMEGSRGEWLNSGRGEISLCLSLWSEMRLIAFVGLRFSVFDHQFINVSDFILHQNLII